MALSASTRTTVFISYSHADHEWLERLKRHLRPLVRRGRLDCWDDTHIQPGDDGRQEIQKALDKASRSLQNVEWMEKGRAVSGPKSKSGGGFNPCTTPKLTPLRVRHRRLPRPRSRGA